MGTLEDLSKKSILEERVLKKYHFKLANVQESFYSVVKSIKIQGDNVLYRKYFSLVSVVWVLVISSFSFCAAMNDWTHRDVPPGSHIPASSPRNYSDEDSSNSEGKINAALRDVLPHHREFLKHLQYVSGEIFYKTVPSNLRDKPFLDALDKAVLYPKGSPLTFTRRAFDFFSKVWWGTIDGAASGAFLPIILVAGGDLFNFIPDDSLLVVIPLVLMVPSFIYQGVKLAEFMRQFLDPRGIQSIKPRGLKVLDIQGTRGLFRTKEENNATEIDQLMDIGRNLTEDTEPYLLPHRNLNFHRFLSLSFAVWENWKYALFFWYIERYTYDTRLWRSIFLPSYIIQSVGKDSEYFMNYFEKENTKRENEAFINHITIKKKKFLLNSLRITRHLINGPESDPLVDAMYQPLQERKNKIEFFMKVEDALDTYGSDSDKRNPIIQGAIVEHIKRKVPTFNETWESTLCDDIDCFLTANFMFDTNFTFDKNTHMSKIYNFTIEKILYLTVKNAVEKTLKDTRPTWNDELEEAVYQYLNKTKEMGGEQNIKKRIDHFKGIVGENYANKIDVFMDDLPLDAGFSKKAKCYEDFTESGVSLFLPRAKVASSNQEKGSPSLLRETEQHFIEDLKSQSSKSTVKSTLQEVSKVLLSFNSLLRFICTLWASKLIFEFAGADPTVSFYMSLGVAALDSGFGIIKNWYPQQQEFADIRNINAQRDFKYLRLGNQVVFAGFPAVFAAMATAGIVWTALEKSTEHWLIYLLLIRGMPSEVMSQFNFFGTGVEEIITSLVTWLPMPACLKPAQNRAILNKDLKMTEQIIAKLSEPSTERYYDLWSKSRQEEMDR